MIKEVIDLLKSEEWEDGGELIQFAKGKYETPQGFNGWLKHLKLRTRGRR